jgi:hypothetical protein
MTSRCWTTRLSSDRHTERSTATIKLNERSTATFRLNWSKFRALGPRVPGVRRAAPGHYQRVSPTDAIADMLAPVILISAGWLFANGLMSADAVSSKRLQDLNSERLSLLAGPRGEKLAKNQVPDVSRARLELIDHQVPLVIARIRGIRDSCVLVYIAMGLLLLSIIFIAAAIPDHSVALAYTALALVVCGVIIQFAAIILATRVMIRSADSLTYETRRANELGLPMRL